LAVVDLDRPDALANHRTIPNPLVALIPTLTWRFGRCDRGSEIM
jgi:hypothetical protein